MEQGMARPRASEAIFSDRIDGPRTLAIVLIPILLLAAVAIGRGWIAPVRQAIDLAAGAGLGTPAELAGAAADRITEALAPGGSGVEFEIVQTSTITARQGGPLVEVPHPTDRGKSLGQTDAYLLGTLIQRGFATPDGFWMELLHGPKPGAEADFDLAEAPVSRQALVRGGSMFRNDGQGWHATDVLPGIGLDPVTTGKLAALLTESTGAIDTAPDQAGVAPRFPGLRGSEHAAVRSLEATAKVADVPGIIAADLAAATEIRKPARFFFDEDGRLIGLSIVARNKNLEPHDLIVETVITFRYPDAPPTLPEPLPAYVAPAAESEGE